MLILVIGDAQTPWNSTQLLPQKLAKLLVSGKITHVFSLGNMGREAKSYLPTLGQVHWVGGEWDVDGEDSRVVDVGIKFGLVGMNYLDDAAKASMARRLNVDVLLTPSPFSSLEYEGKFFISPGSCSGVDSDPSFVLMDVGQRGVVLYVYKVVNDELKIEKVEWNKSY